ncbi:PIN domain-containing protein [Variovorax sp. DT-64]|uniref:PIN domain-containing protein n=1 Tax=Variovorax sp. DT-64 TaxID=3396160 RepID=UPI003F1A75FB
MKDRAFADTNVVLYMMSKDAAKAERARTVVAGRPIISVQVLNEITSVARRKLTLPWKEIDEFLQLARGLCPVEPLTVESHDLGRALSEKYQLSVYYSMILSSALLSGCDTLYSEDMQDSLRIEQTLTIVNPFRPDGPNFAL